MLSRNLKLLAAIAGLGAALILSAHAQTLILEPSTTTIGAGSPFSLKVSINTAGLPIAGFSVYFNMAGTDASGSFVVQSETLSTDWSFLGAGPSFPSALPDSGNSQDHGNAATPTLADHSPGSYLWLFTLQIQPGLATAPGNYTIQTTMDSIFFYGVLSGGTEVNLPSSSINVTVVPEPSTFVLALSSVGILVLLRRRNGSRH